MSSSGLWIAVLPQASQVPAGKQAAHGDTKGRRMKVGFKLHSWQHAERKGGREEELGMCVE